LHPHDAGGRALDVRTARWAHAADSRLEAAPGVPRGVAVERSSVRSGLSDRPGAIFQAALERAELIRRAQPFQLADVRPDRAHDAPALGHVPAKRLERFLALNRVLDD